MVDYSKWNKIMDSDSEEGEGKVISGKNAGKVEGNSGEMPKRFYKNHSLTKLSWKNIMLEGEELNELLVNRTSTSITVKGKWKTATNLVKDVFITFINPSQVSNYDYDIERYALLLEAEKFAFFHKQEISNVSHFYGVIEEVLPDKLQKVFYAGEKEECFAFVTKSLPKKSFPFSEYTVTASRSVSLSLSDKVHMIYQIIQSLAELHAIRYIHGDLHGGVITINGHHPPAVRLTNFHYSTTITQAKKLDTAVASSLLTKKSFNILQKISFPFYCVAPEILLIFLSNSDLTLVEYSSTLSMAADIYAFSMICWELLMDRTPFRTHGDRKGLLEDIISGARPDVSPLRNKPAIPPDLITMLEKAWDPDPAVRPTSVECLMIIQQVLDFLEENGGGDDISYFDERSLKSSQTGSFKGITSKEELSKDVRISSVIIRNNSSDSFSVMTRSSSSSSIASEADNNESSKSIIAILEEDIAEPSVTPSEPPLAKQSFHDVKSWIATFHLPSSTFEVFTTNKLLSLQQIFDIWSSDFAKMEKILYDITSDNDVLDRFVTGLDEIGILLKQRKSFEIDLLQWLEDHQLTAHDELLTSLLERSILTLDQLKATPDTVVVQEIAVPLKPIPKRKFIQGWKVLNGFPVTSVTLPSLTSSVTSLPPADPPQDTKTEGKTTSPTTSAKSSSPVGDERPLSTSGKETGKVLERDLLLWLNEKGIFQPEITRALKAEDILNLESLLTMTTTTKDKVASMLKPITNRKFLRVMKDVLPPPDSTPLKSEGTATTTSERKSPATVGLSSSSPSLPPPIRTDTPPATSPSTSMTPPAFGRTTPPARPLSTATTSPRPASTTTTTPVALKSCLQCNRQTNKKYFCDLCIERYEIRSGERFTGVCYHCCYCGKRSFAKNYCETCYEKTLEEHNLCDLSYYYCYHCGQCNDQKKDKYSCQRCHKPSRVYQKEKKICKAAKPFTITKIFGFGGGSKKKKAPPPITPTPPNTTHATVNRSSSVDPAASPATNSAPSGNKPPRRCLKCHGVTRKRYFCEECVTEHEARTGRPFNGNCILCRRCSTHWTMNDDGYCEQCSTTVV